MIEPETATRAAQLLSTAIGEMVEDEHIGMLATLKGVREGLARAERLEALGADMATLARAMGVLLSRSEEPPL